ncbi:hypothetical protein [Selenomonas ruminantium]|uniref:Uncharacterized protein n=1 Tax=Selenomonas ruminantium TaxID=971 RepID=A0A1I0Y9J7_SELRU|nr:hypothetical protein [Selenomonas ruminantium]SFB10075.1 hypothetical protein SAMN05216587_11129 [Selenomonas ruminantium]
MRVLMAKGKEIKMYGGKFWGVEVSPYGMKHKCLDYKTMVIALTYNECFSNYNVMTAVNDWDLENGSDYNEENDEYIEVMDYLIMSPRAAENIKKYTDEIVYYSPSLDLYVLGVCHCGTSWDYVSTDYEIIGE